VNDENVIRLLIGLCGFLGGAVVAASVHFATVVQTKTRVAALEEWRIEAIREAHDRADRISKLEGLSQVVITRIDALGDSLLDIKVIVTAAMKRLADERN
jgi:hypothetical protein